MKWCKQVMEMGSKDRIARNKENIRCNILSAALNIGKNDGWNAVSMRKIADSIEYSVPVIYDHFESKEGLLRELAREGFVLLLHRLREAAATSTDPHKQLPMMWIAYWEFAMAEHELYQIMFGIEFSCCDLQQTLTETQTFVSLFQDLIAEILSETDNSSPIVQKYYYTFWSLVHGLVSINLIRVDVPKNISLQVLAESVEAIMKTLLISEPTELTYPIQNPDQ